MTRISQVRKSPVRDAEPRQDVAKAEPVVQQKNSGFAALWESASQQILTVTYWFDPSTQPGPYPVTVRFSGRRVDAQGRLQADDRFVQDETIEKVIPGSGPISLTARVSGIHPGKWVVTAQPYGTDSSTRKSRKQGNASPTVDTLQSSHHLWYKWAPIVGSTEPISTCPTPFARVPGILPGIWAAMVLFGIIVALTLQSLVIAREHLVLGPVRTLSLVSIAVGIIGAKTWFIVLYRSERRVEGWCIQGFVLGATLTAAILLVALRVPAGVFLDATAPGLLLAMAVGRVGCFFAGCCYGRPTASRWAMWSSDQRVGVRRIPTQLLELTLALVLGLVILAVVLSRGPANGAIIVAGLAAYTLVRQGILHLRAEPRKMKWSGPITAALSALILVAALFFLVR